MIDSIKPTESRSKRLLSILERLDDPAVFQVNDFSSHTVFHRNKGGKDKEKILNHLVDAFTKKLRGIHVRSHTVED